MIHSVGDLIRTQLQTLEITYTVFENVLKTTLKRKQEIQQDML
jgi:hypothetical protein